MSVQARDNASCLKGLRQSGSLKALFPRSSGPDFQAVFINTAGGITGGDRFKLDANAGSNARLTLTTQAAERAYLAQSGQVGNIQTHLSVGSGGRLNWLPQETILFQGCALKRSLQIEMADDAALLMVEPLVFGRKAMGETLTDASFCDRVEIRRQGQLIYYDAIKLSGDVFAKLARPHTAAGAGAMASLVYVAKDAENLLEDVRALLGATAGASLIHDDLLVMRMLAGDSYLMRKTLIPVLNLLTNDNLPRCWMT